MARHRIEPGHRVEQNDSGARWDEARSESLPKRLRQRDHRAVPVDRVEMRRVIGELREAVQERRAQRLRDKVEMLRAPLRLGADRERFEDR